MENAGADARRHGGHLRRSQRSRRACADPEERPQLLHRAVLLRRLGVPDRLFVLPAGRRLPDRPHRAAHRLRRGRARLGVGGGAARPCHGLDLDGEFSRFAWPFRGRRNPDGDQNVDRLVPGERALDRNRMVQFGLVDRLDDHAAARHLARRGLGLARRRSSSPARSASSFPLSGIGSIATPKRIPICRRRNATIFSAAASPRPPSRRGGRCSHSRSSSASSSRGS